MVLHHWKLKDWLWNLFRSFKLILAQFTRKKCSLSWLMPGLQNFPYFLNSLLVSSHQGCSICCCQSTITIIQVVPMMAPNKLPSRLGRDYGLRGLRGMPGCQPQVSHWAKALGLVSWQNGLHFNKGLVEVGWVLGRIIPLSKWLNNHGW